MRGTKDKYVFERICFGDVAFDLSENVTNRARTFRRNIPVCTRRGWRWPNRGDTDFAEEYADSATAGTVYTLRIYLPGVDYPIFSTEVYSNNFYIAEEDYEAPDDKYLKGDAAQ
ncbi:MAG: hypothetical protein ACLUFV_04420 [Acutalibacteraceae bacterium]